MSHKNFDLKKLDPQDGFRLFTINQNQVSKQIFFYFKALIGKEIIQKIFCIVLWPLIKH